MTIAQAIPLFAVLAGAPALYANETPSADQAGAVAPAKDQALDAKDTSINAKDTSINAKDSAKSEEAMPVAAATPAGTPATCPVVRVHFAFDSADIPAKDQAALQDAAGCLKKNDRLQVTVEGNTDDRGTAEYNQGLSDRRAQAVSTYLEGQGIAATQLKTKGFGEDRPVCNEQNEDCWQRNRRTAIRPACHL